jgi:hypothetical protein
MIMPGSRVKRVDSSIIKDCTHPHGSCARRWNASVPTRKLLGFAPRLVGREKRTVATEEAQPFRHAAPRSPW